MPIGVYNYVIFIYQKVSIIFMTSPIRILQATVSNDKGGLTGYICQNYRYIDKSKVQFDFLTYETQLDFQEEFEKMGARFYVVPKPSRFWAYIKALKQIREVNEYGAVHFNISYANWLTLLAAKWVGFQRIIVHSHSTEIDDKRKLVRGMKKCIHHVGKMLMPALGTDFLACSQLAGRWMYPDSILQGKKYHLAKNAINLEKYRFNSAMRKAVRQELGIGENEFCIGHIGRFNYQKNHAFLIDIFYKLLKVCPNAKLLLIGDGPYLFNIKRSVTELRIEDSVFFLGRRNDVPQLLQAMDCFVLPSRFEGLPIVGVEAQAAGVPCIVSDAITQELNINGLVRFVSLRDKEKWVNSIMAYHGFTKRDQLEKLRNAGYDISLGVNRLVNFYENIVTSHS